MKNFWIRIIPGIAWFFILLFLLCLPGEDIPTEDWLDKIYFDKIVHFCSFLLLCSLFFYPFYKPAYPGINTRKALIIITTLGISWGIITEFIQYFFVPGRNFDPFDMVFDALGALTSYWFWSRFLKNKAFTSHSN